MHRLITAATLFFSFKQLLYNEKAFRFRDEEVSNVLLLLQWNDWLSLASEEQVSCLEHLTGHFSIKNMMQIGHTWTVDCPVTSKLRLGSSVLCQEHQDARNILLTDTAPYSEQRLNPCFRVNPLQVKEPAANEQDWSATEAFCTGTEDSAEILWTVCRQDEIVDVSDSDDL